MSFRYNRRRNLPRSPLRKAMDWMMVIFVFGLLLFVIVRLDEVSAIQAQGVPTVIDGDSLVLNGVKLRLEGIDAPEYQQLCRKGTDSYPCGRDARNHLARLISKRPVNCKGWQHDKYGRLLSRCSSAGGELNKQMVSSGWAVAYGDYFAEESEARAAKQGVWQGEFERPSSWRKLRGDITEAPHDVWLKITSFFKKLFAL